MITKTKQLQRMAEEYRNAGQRWPATMEEIADWAVEEKRYDLTAPALKKLVARELAQALRNEFFTDDQGRRVRAKHPARVRRGGRQLMLWDDIRTASRHHMQMAFQLRRRCITYECKQVKTDVDSYNDAHPEERPIRMVLDFRQDVKELEIEDIIYSSANEPSQQPELSRDVVLETV